MLNSRRFNQEIRRLDDGRIYFIQDHTMNIHSMYEYITNVHPVAGAATGSSGPRSALRFTGLSNIASSNTEVMTMTFTPPITIDFWFKYDATYRQTYAPIILSQTAGVGFPAAPFCAFGPVFDNTNSVVVPEILGVRFTGLVNGTITAGPWIHCQFLLPSTGLATTCRINGGPSLSTSSTPTYPSWTTNAHRYIQIRTAGGIEFGNIRLSTGDVPVTVENDPVPNSRTIVLIKGHVTPELTIPNRCSIAEHVDFFNMGATSKSHVWSGWYNIPRDIQTVTAFSQSNIRFDCRVVIGRPFEPRSLDDMMLAFQMLRLEFGVFNGNFGGDVNWFTGRTATGAGFVSDLSSISAATNGFVPNTGYAVSPFSVQWRGTFVPNVTANWTFTLHADDESYVWVGDVANSGFTTTNRTIFAKWDLNSGTTTVILALTAGVSYPIRIQYVQSVGGYNFSLSITGPPGQLVLPYTNTYSTNITLPINIIHGTGTKFDGITLNSTIISRSEMRSGCVPYKFRLEQNGRTLKLDTNTGVYDWDRGMRDGIFITSNAIQYNSSIGIGLGTATVDLNTLNRPGSNVTCLCIQDAVTLRTCAFNANGTFVLLPNPGKQTLANTMMHMRFSNIWNPATNQSFNPILFRALY